MISVDPSEHSRAATASNKLMLLRRVIKLFDIQEWPKMMNQTLYNGIMLPDVIVPTGEDAWKTMLEAKDRTAMNTTM